MIMTICISAPAHSTAYPGHNLPGGVHLEVEESYGPEVGVDVFKNRGRRRAGHGAGLKT